MHSINEQELGKFDKISKKWWDIDGEFGILHQINPIRLEYILDKITAHFKKHIPEDINNITILDIGCGGGLISVPLSKAGFNVTAIDALQNNIDTAVDYARENNLTINYLKSTIEELPDTQYDVVLCLEVIEHVNNQDQFIKNLARLIKPEGMAIISTINRTKKAYLFAIMIAEYILGWVPKNTHDYSKFLKPSEIYEMVKNTNLTMRELKGLNFDIANNKWRLSDDIDVNYFTYLTRN